MQQKQYWIKNNSEAPFLTLTSLARKLNARSYEFLRKTWEIVRFGIQQTSLGWYKLGSSLWITSVRSFHSSYLPPQSCVCPE